MQECQHKSLAGNRLGETEKVVLRNITQLVCLAYLLLFSRTEARACSCSIPEIPQAVESAKAVFVGFVTDIIEPRTNDPKAPWADRLYVVKFKIGISWKGNLAREVTSYRIRDAQVVIPGAHL